MKKNSSCTWNPQAWTDALANYWLHRLKTTQPLDQVEKYSFQAHQEIAKAERSMYKHDHSPDHLHNVASLSKTWGGAYKSIWKEKYTSDFIPLSDRRTKGCH